MKIDPRSNCSSQQIFSFFSAESNEPKIEDMLKNCTPEKLKAIQRLISKYVDKNVTSEPTPTELPAIPCELRSQTEQETIVQPPNVEDELTTSTEASTAEKLAPKRSFSDAKSTPVDADDCIVLSDSDDDVPQPPKKSRPDSTVVNGAPCSSTTLVKSKKPKPPPKVKECANPNCNDPNTLLEKSPLFMLNILSIPVKKTQQYLCVVCFDKAIELIEVGIQIQLKL